MSKDLKESLEGGVRKADTSGRIFQAVRKITKVILRQKHVYQV